MERLIVKRNLLTGLLMMMVCHLHAFYLPGDSIGMEKKGNKNYILHKVDPKETLFSISRKYNVSLSEIKAANPQLAKALDIGQVLKVPYTAKVKLQRDSGKHTVASKETWYSISRKYSISVEELKKANSDNAQGLRPGMEITIPGNQPVVKVPDIRPQGNVTAKAEVKAEVKKEEIKPAPAEEAPGTRQRKKKEVTKEEKDDDYEEEEEEEEKEPAKTVRQEKTIVVGNMPAPVNSGYKKVNESGFAGVMEENAADLKYLALHKNAPAGTIIQVKNDDTNQKIFVRVSGKLVSSGDKVILRISPKAFERLGGKGEKIPVSISYIP
jgi:LysM repeat protein